MGDDRSANKEESSLKTNPSKEKVTFKSFDRPFIKESKIEDDNVIDETPKERVKPKDRKIRDLNQLPIADSSDKSSKEIVKLKERKKSNKTESENIPVKTVSNRDSLD